MLDWRTACGIWPAEIRKAPEPIVSAIRQTLTILKRIAIVIGIAIAFTLGLLGAIYLSLRSSETRVPDIVGKDRNAAETTISDAGLNFRVRATRATSEAKPDTVLIQLPRAGEVVKVGQTVAVDISRPTKEGEPSTPVNTNENMNKPENSSASSSNNSNANANANANRKKPANRNANDNLNANANRPTNRNRNGNTNLNANTTPINHNANAGGTPARSNSNSNAPARNVNRPAVNANRRPVTAPTP
jgi:PASTA domain-containing protein